MEHTTLSSPPLPVASELEPAAVQDRLLNDRPAHRSRPRFRSYQSDQWALRFQDLNAFRQEFGHCHVPHVFPANPALAQWVKRQRYQYKLYQRGAHSTLTPERLQGLRQLGFVFDSHMAAWEERMEELRRYHAKFGTCRVVPNASRVVVGAGTSGDSSSSSKDWTQLAMWIKTQRRQYRLFQKGQPSTMTVERIAQFDKLGLVWNPSRI